MAINFPDSPTIGDEYTAGGFTWTWTGSTWSKVGAGGGTGGNGFNIYVGATGQTTFTFAEEKPAGTYTITSANNDTVYDIYFVTDTNTNAGYSNSFSIVASDPFTKVVVYGGNSGDILRFEEEESVGPSGNGDLVGGASPFITSVNPGNLPVSGATAVITGGNFAPDVQVSLVGQNGVAVPVTTLVRNSVTQITITRPAALDSQQAPFDVKVVNPGIPEPTASQRHVLADSVIAANPAKVYRFSNTRAQAVVTGAVMDSAGNTYVGISDSNGGSDGGAALLKIDTSDNIVWRRTWRNSYGGGFAMTIDANDNIYTGGFYGWYPGEYTALSQKINTDGTVLWQKNQGGGQTYSGTGLETRSNGTLSIQGSQYYGDNHWWVLDGNGNVVWSKSVGYGSSYGNAARYAIGPDRVALGRWTRFSVYNAAGTYLWGKDMGWSDQTSNLHVDKDNNVYHLARSGDPSAGPHYLTKYDLNGTMLWQKTISRPNGVGDFTSSTGNMIRTDDSNNVYFGFNYRSNSDNPSKMWYVIKFNSTGSVIWQRSIDVASADDNLESVHIPWSTSMDVLLLGGSQGGGANGGVVKLQASSGSPTGSGTIGVTWNVAAGAAIIANGTVTPGSHGDFGGSAGLGTPSITPGTSTGHSFVVGTIG